MFIAVKPSIIIKMNNFKCNLIITAFICFTVLAAVNAGDQNDNAAAIAVCESHLKRAGFNYEIGLNNYGVVNFMFYNNCANIPSDNNLAIKYCHYLIEASDSRILSTDLLSPSDWCNDKQERYIANCNIEQLHVFGFIQSRGIDAYVFMFFNGGFKKLNRATNLYIEYLKDVARTLKKVIDNRYVWCAKKVKT